MRPGKAARDNPNIHAPSIPSPHSASSLKNSTGFAKSTHYSISPMAASPFLVHPHQRKGTQLRESFINLEGWALSRASLPFLFSPPLFACLAPHHPRHSHKFTHSSFDSTAPMGVRSVAQRRTAFTRLNPTTQPPRAKRTTHLTRPRINLDCGSEATALP
jgi:hypothetical protein